MTSTDDTDQATAMGHLKALKATFYDRVSASGDAARAGTLTKDHLQAVFEAGNAVDEACEAFRRRFYPRSGRVITALGQVLVVSPTGRRTRTVDA